MRAAVILVTLLLSAAALPARAAMQPVGSVMLLPVNTGTAVTYTNLRGDILALTARGNADVGCHAVVATFADGSYTEIFHGVLPPDELFKVYLPGGVRDIQRIDFNCLSIDRGRAIIDVNANVVPGGFITLLSGGAAASD
jgi:hypothetical protein